MFDPILEEICRARIDKSAPTALGRWQTYLRNDVDPQLARLAALEAENLDLKAQLAKRTGKKAEAAA